jgi:hypothetical protein
MSQNQVATKGSEAMQNVAEHYASELNAQFRTLNHFVGHTGEIGRAHETFLRGVLDRFLSPDINVSSGFVAHPKWTSRQQDILLHLNNFSTLFKVGDCTVIDHKSFLGAIEVKTTLSSAQFKNTIKMQAQLRNEIQQSGLFAVYAWGGVSIGKALNTLWEFVRINPPQNFDFMPDVVYVRGKYILIANRDGDRQSPPYHCWHVKKNGITEGEALLGLVASFWKFGLKTVLPWWLLSWHQHLGVVVEKSQEVPWPDDLQLSVMGDINP